MGDVAFTNPTDGATVAGANLVATWTDSGSGNPGYSAVYFVSISGTNAGFAYVGTDRQAPVSNLLSPATPLPPGSYTGELSAWSGGFTATGSGSVTISNNISGAGVTGTFYSSSQASQPVSFTIQLSP